MAVSLAGSAFDDFDISTAQDKTPKAIFRLQAKRGIVLGRSDCPQDDVLLPFCVSYIEMYSLTHQTATAMPELLHTAHAPHRPHCYRTDSVDVITKMRHAQWPWLGIVFDVDRAHAA